MPEIAAYHAARNMERMAIQALLLGTGIEADVCDRNAEPSH